MNYDEITKITAERISDYMTEAVNTDSIAVAEMVTGSFKPSGLFPPALQK